MKWVKWSDWTGPHYMLPEGEMTLEEAEQRIKELGQRAADLLKESGADHVIYAVKRFDANNEVTEVEFHMVALTDEQFKDRAMDEPGVIVYAHHARK